MVESYNSIHVHVPSSFSLSLSLQDRSLVDEVLETIVDFAEMFTMNDQTRVLALEIYTELLDLFDPMLLPGVLQRQAEMLMNLVKIQLFRSKL